MLVKIYQSNSVLAQQKKKMKHIFVLAFILYGVDYNP